MNLPDDGKRKKAVTEQTYIHAPIIIPAALIFRAAVSFCLFDDP